MRLPGAAVLVTGGASGIGFRVATRLLGLGARVWVVDRDEAAIARCREESGPAPGITWLAGNVGEPGDVERVVAEAEAASGGLDVLVNNAGVLRDQTLVSRLGKRVRQHSLEDWQETLQSNLTGTFLMARAVATAMLGARRRGLILNVSSVVRTGNPGQSAYAATKAAVESLTVTWARELAPYGVRVAALSPGFVETGMTRNIPPVFLDKIRESSPVGRFGELDEFAHAVQFIIENDYFAGRVLDLDGGLRF